MKTTAKDFKLYQEYCHNWQVKLNLQHYAIAFIHDNSRPDTDAWVLADSENGIASVGLTIDWDAKPTRQDLDRAACHEMLELLHWEIRNLLSAIFCNEVINRKLHNVIRPLENLFFS